MGPFSQKTQNHRADNIKCLLKNNPQLDDYMKSMWKMKLNDLAVTVDEYDIRVKQVYSLMKPKHLGWVSYE